MRSRIIAMTSRRSSNGTSWATLGENSRDACVSSQDRRSALTASRAASVPVPEAPDPILAAIEGHRRDFEVLRRLLAEQDAAERELRYALMGRRAALEAQLAHLCEAEGPLGSAEMKASLRLAETVPASLTGAAAALRYVRERYEVGHYPMYEEDGYRLLLFSAERAICAAAGLSVA